MEPGFSFAAKQSISTGKRVSTENERMPAMSFGVGAKSLTAPKKTEEEKGEDKNVDSDDDKADPNVHLV